MPLPAFHSASVATGSPLLRTNLRPFSPRMQTLAFYLAVAFSVEISPCPVVKTLSSTRQRSSRRERLVLELLASIARGRQGGQLLINFLCRDGRDTQPPAATLYPQLNHFRDPGIKFAPAALGLALANFDKTNRSAHRVLPVLFAMIVFRRSLPEPEARRQ